MKDVTLIFGRTDKGAYETFPLANTIIVGDKGSGKGVLIQNIIDALLLRYTSHDVQFDFYDHKAVEFIKDADNATGIRTVTMCRNAANSHEVSITSWLKEYVQLLAQRATNRDIKHKPLIVFLDSIEVAIAAAHPMAITYLTHLLSSGPRYNIYTIMITDADAGFIDEYIHYTDNRICLRVDNTEVMETVVGIESSLEVLPEYGEAWVLVSGMKLMHITVPYYTKHSKLDICSGNLLPNDAAFDSYHLIEYGLSNRLFHE